MQQVIAGVKLPALLCLLAKAGSAIMEGVVFKYTHRRYFNACLFATSQVILVALLEAIRASPAFSILCDGSTDVGLEDHMLIYVAYIEAGAFFPTVTYLCTVKIQSGTGESLKDTVMKVLEVLDIPHMKMVGFITDGAASFTGRISGAVTRVRAIVPYLVGVHCIAHRTSLVMVSASKSLAPLSGIDLILRNVHSLFSKSAKRQGTWEHFATPLGVTRFSFPLFNATRWFSRMQCIFVLTDNLHALIPFLTSKCFNWNSAMVVLRKMLGFKLASTLFIYRDILMEVEILSKDFQREGPTGVKAFELRSRVDSVISILKRYLNPSYDIRVTPIHREAHFIRFV